MPYASDKVREVSARLIEGDDSTRMAEMVLGTTSPEYGRAFAKLIRHRGQDAALTVDEREAPQRAMAIGAGSTGGYLVPFQLDPSVILTANGSFNQVRPPVRPRGHRHRRQVARCRISVRWTGRGTRRPIRCPTIPHVHPADRPGPQGPDVRPGLVRGPGG